MSANPREVGGDDKAAVRAGPAVGKTCGAQRRLLCRRAARAGNVGRMTGVEPLEPRRLLAAAGPAAGPLVAHRFVGEPEGITAVVLTFNVPLDPATAQNPQAYEFIRKITRDFKSSDELHGENPLKARANRHIPVESATYDAAANTVTLVPREAFRLSKDFAVIVV